MVDTPASNDRIYCFGPFRLDVPHQQLYKDDQPLELPRRLVRTLQLLVENHGKDLEKTYLMEQLWPDTVVEESNLTVIISMLRKVLGDDAAQKKYILTNPRRGYRFVGDVVEATTGGVDTPDRTDRHSTQAFEPARESPPAESRGVLRRHRSAVFASLLCLVVLTGIYAWHARQTTQSIAVLPFQSVGTDDEEGYLGLGLADALIARLRNIRHVVVRSTTEVAKYQNTPYDPQVLGKDLNVVSLLDGTVQRTGDQVWLRVKLLRVKDGAILWTHEYHGRFADILTMQDQMADEVTRALALKLSTEEQLSIHRRYTSSAEAYRLYIAGRAFCTSTVRYAALEKGISYFQQATAKDPQFALAYAGLANCYQQLSGRLPYFSQDIASQLEGAAQRALEIDARLPEPYLALGQAKLYGSWDYPGAEAAFRKSIDLDPEDTTSRVAYAELLIGQGRFHEAEREALKVADLDPFSLDASVIINRVYFFSRRYQEAADGLDKIRLANLEDTAWFLVWIYALQGRANLMIDDLVSAETAAPSSSKAVYTSVLAYVYAVSGMKAEAHNYLQKLSSEDPRNVDEYQTGLIYAALGEKDKAFACLGEAKQKHSWILTYAKVDPRLDSLRSDPRFIELLREIRLSP